MKGFPIAILFILFLTACEKEKSTPLPEEEYYGFNALIGEKQIELKYSEYEKWITTQNGSIDQVTTYGVIVDLSKDYVNNLVQPKLAFQLYDLEEKLYKIDTQELYPDLRENRITISKIPLSLDSERVVYAPNPNKEAFEIRVISIEYHAYSMIPTVSGSLQGILYNINNDQDSITIKNGNFTLRY